MKKIILISTLIFFSVICIAHAATTINQIKDKEVVEIIKQHINYRNPDLTSVVLLNDQHYTLGGDSTVIFKEHTLLKIMTPGGKGMGTIMLPFNTYFQKFKIITARTIQPDGKVIDVPSELISEESPFYNMPVYSDLKYKKITFPAVDVASVIEYEVEYHIDYKNLPSFYNMFYIIPGCIQRVVRFTVDVPKDTYTNFKAVRLYQCDYKKTTSGGRDIYKWELENTWIESSSLPFLPAYMHYGSYIPFSTIKSWDDVYRKYKDIVKGQAEPDAGIKEKVKELTADAKGNKVEIIKRLYEYVAQNIRYVAVGLGEMAYKPYPASEVFINKYGDCKGKSALLIAMLKAADIPAYFALMITTDIGFIENKIPSNNFNHAIVAIPHEDSYLFIDPTANLLPSGELPFSIQGTEAFILGNKGVEFVKTSSSDPEDNIVSEESTMTIQKDNSMEMNTIMTFKGQDAWLQRLFAQSQGQRGYEDTLKQLIGTIVPNAYLHNYKASDYSDVDSPYQLETKISAKDYAKKTGNMLLLAIPLSVDAYALRATAMDRGGAPIDLLYPKAYKSKIIIETPKKYKVKALPDNATYDTDVFSFDVKFSSENGKILIDSISRYKERIIQKKYPRIKTGVDKLRNIYSQSIILESM
jgi:transglutaminase-like putative cysteine protease